MELKNIVMGLAIIILTTFVVIYGIQTFYERPEYEDFCGDRDSKIARPIIETQGLCEAEGGVWNPYNEPFLEERTGYCDFYSECNAEYEAAREPYAKNLFIIAIILGIILLAVGGALFELEAVGAGIMGGGIVTLIYGAGNYWEYAGDLFRFALSLIGLILAIYLAYWLNKRTKKGWKFSFKARRK
tara:strand:- start:3 stop:560 length:558 start_codon:yes stop_codon:yes gene_type:complete